LESQILLQEDEIGSIENHACFALQCIVVVVVVVGGGVA